MLFCFLFHSSYCRFIVLIIQFWTTKYIDSDLAVSCQWKPGLGIWALWSVGGGVDTFYNQLKSPPYCSSKGMNDLYVSQIQSRDLYAAIHLLNFALRTDVSPVVVTKEQMVLNLETFGVKGDVLRW